MMMKNPSALLLDYGNVLSLPQRGDGIEIMAARLDVEAETFLAAYVSARAAYDAGEPPDEYWRRVVTRLGRAPLLSPSLVAALIEDDTSSWSDQREEVWDIAAGFRARGGRTAFLSNNVPPLMARLRAERRLDQIFDVVTASCEVRVAKPDPAIFHHCLDTLGVAPGDALFVDDHPANIGAAARLGIHTFQFEGEDAVARLRRAVESRVVGA
jgi:putative hydrolase of the HAD superfamily